jgi:CBS domain containing-hemolysin-like protein
MIELAPWLAGMGVLIGCSAFFSGSEAALFYLRWQDRRALAAGGRAQRAAAALLANPDRLLSAVLLLNLVTNMAYFSIASIVAVQLERGPGRSAAVLFSAGSVLTLIFLGEMFPKSAAVLSARSVARWVALPLSACVRLLDPIMPVLRLITLLSQRLFWPRFQPEPYLEIGDLERAIELSAEDAALREQERATLRNIVMMSDTRVEEWMRPRTQYVTFREPVSLADLEGRMTASGYLLTSESDGDEVVAALNLLQLSEVPAENLERLAQPVLYVPWCATVADVLQQMKQQRREVAAVVNEMGETIGVLTFEDVLATMFHENPSRSHRLLNREPIQKVADAAWHVTGITNLRRLERYFGVELPPTTNVTVGGVVQDCLQRLAAKGDEVDWGPFHFRVLKAPRRGHLFIEVTRRTTEEPTP